MYDNNGEAVTFARQGQLIAASPPGHIFRYECDIQAVRMVLGTEIVVVDRREVSVQLTLNPTPFPYTVLISSYYPNEEREFSLRIFATLPINPVQPYPAGGFVSFVKLS